MVVYMPENMPSSPPPSSQELLPEALPEGDSGAASGPGASPSKGILEVLGLKKGWHSRSGSSATDGGSSWTEEQVQVR